MSDAVNDYLLEQIRSKDQVIASLMKGNADTWDQGFSACALENQKQRLTPEYPITRDNPYRDRSDWGDA